MAAETTSDHSYNSGEKMKEESEDIEYSAVDTTEQFNEIFKTHEFDSWDEFALILEEFQRATGAAFKPKCATTVETRNAGRVKGLIPQRFRYQTVNMICNHYGLPRVSESTKKRRCSYLSVGCEAYFKLSYCKGKLHLTSCHLVHSNHALVPGSENLPRPIHRGINFTADLDLIIARKALDFNVFEKKYDEVEWKNALAALHKEDPVFELLTLRALRRRVQYLIDKQIVDNYDVPGPPSDEMGKILEELAELRRQRLFAPKMKRGPKKQSKYRTILPASKNSSTLGLRRSTRKRKRKRWGSDDESDDDTNKRNPRARNNSESHIIDDDDDDDDDIAEVIADSPGRSPSSPEKTKTADKTSSVPRLSNMDAFWAYWQRRDEEERKLRRHEVSLREQEYALRQNELKFQKHRFECERQDRESLIQLLIHQSQYSVSSIVVEDPGKEEIIVCTQ